MRFISIIVVGSICALAASQPALAKNTESRKTDEKSTPTSCHAYQRAADGSWTEVPCQEAGAGHTEHKPAAKGAEEEPR